MGCALIIYAVVGASVRREGAGVLSRRAVSLAVLAGSVMLLLVAVGCRGGEASQASDERSQPAPVSEAPAPEPSEPILPNTVTATTALPTSVSDAEDEPTAPSNAVAVTAAPEKPRSGQQELPLCRELVLEAGDAWERNNPEIEEFAEPYFGWGYDPAPAGSDGWSVSAQHAPDPAWANSALYAVFNARRADPRAYQAQYLFVTVAGESAAEQTYRLPLVPPWEAHPSLHFVAHAGRIVATSDGWMIPVSVVTFMDWRQVVPQHVAGYALGRLWTDPHVDESGQIGGLRIVTSSHYDPSNSEECFSSWADLGTTRELYDRYGSYARHGKPYHSVGQESGYLWVSRWDGEPVQVELPDQWGGCCGIQMLDDGYLVFSDQVQAGTWVRPWMAPGLHYSRGGIDWREVELPTRKFTYSDAPDHPDTEWIDIPIWVCSVESIDGGVLIEEGQGGPMDIQCGITRYWVADADLTNWRLHPDAANADG